jgi:thioredoxin-dependent peroxiredoxin
MTPVPGREGHDGARGGDDVDMVELKPGDPAPEFSLSDQHGEVVSLSDFRGRKLLLYFFPKANTAG